MAADDAAGEFVPDQRLDEPELGEARLELAICGKLRRERLAGVVRGRLELIDAQGAQFEGVHGAAPNVGWSESLYDPV